MKNKISIGKKFSMKKYISIKLFAAAFLFTTSLFMTVPASAEEWYLDKVENVPETRYSSAHEEYHYRHEPVLSKDKRWLTLKHKIVYIEKTPLHEKTINIWHDKVDLKEKYYYGNIYQKRYDERFKKWFSFREKTYTYRDEDILILPGSNQEKQINEACEKLGLTPVLGVKEHVWEWIYANKWKNYFLCKYKVYKNLQENLIWAFIKEASPDKTIKEVEPTVYLVDLTNHRIKRGKWGNWSTILPGSANEAIYKKCEKIMDILKSSNKSQHGLGHE